MQRTWTKSPFATVVRARRRSPPARVFTDMPIRCYDTPMRSSKMHGIGNDYVYVNGFAETVADP